MLQNFKHFIITKNIQRTKFNSSKGGYPKTFKLYFVYINIETIHCTCMTFISWIYCHEILFCEMEVMKINNDHDDIDH